MVGPPKLASKLVGNSGSSVGYIVGYTVCIVVQCYAVCCKVPDKLSVVVGPLGKQLDLPPVQELMKRGEGVLADGTLV